MRESAPSGLGVEDEQLGMQRQRAPALPLPRPAHCAAGQVGVRGPGPCVLAFGVQHQEQAGVTEEAAHRPRPGTPSRKANSQCSQPGRTAAWAPIGPHVPKGRHGPGPSCLTGVLLLVGARLRRELRVGDSLAPEERSGACIILGRGKGCWNLGAPSLSHTQRPKATPSSRRPSDHPWPHKPRCPHQLT